MKHILIAFLALSQTVLAQSTSPANTAAPSQATGTETKHINRLPSGPDGPGRFGAYYTRLEYDAAWDRPWRVGDYPDVVVRFDDGGYRFVFWRGTSYIPCWVTENGIWYNNEFLERQANVCGLNGCIEPMSDKQCRYSHVRIIESSDALVVVQWRYAPVDLEYRQPFVDKQTGWGDWVDELYTIYPDGTGVRKATLYTTNPDDFSEWHEAIIINQPGTMPDDNIEATAVSLANMKGECRDYKWTQEGGPKQFDDMPADCCIQKINLKSERKPFTIVDPRGLRITVYRGHQPGSIFRWWDHWPVSQDKSSSRGAASAEKPSHSSLFNLRDWKEYARTTNSVTRLMLNGLTNRPVNELASLAASWLQAPAVRDCAAGFGSGDYDPTERAYLFTRDAGETGPLEFTLAANKESPLVNPAFVVKNWGDREPTLEINGREIKRGKDFRYGFRRTLEGDDLIVWLKFVAESPTRLSLRARSSSGK